MKSLSNTVFQLLFFLLFFSLLYLEPLSMLGLKFSILWKIPVMLYFSVFLYSYYHNRGNLKIKKGIFYSYLLSFKQLITIGLLSFPITTFVSFFHFLLLPLIWNFFVIYNNYSKAILLVYTISIYIILSAIPFLLNVLTPLAEGVKLKAIGLESFGFIGIFQTPHSASVSMACALLVLLYFQINRRPQKFIIYIQVWALIILGLYVLLQTYVRTGWAMFLVGSMVLLISKKNLKKFVFKVIPILIIAVISLYIIVSNNQALQNRLTDTRVDRVTTSSLEERLGSGRLMIAKASIKGWLESGLAAVILGNGQSLSMKKTGEILGVDLVSHNGFIDILVTNGIVGMLLFLLMFFAINKYINIYKDCSFFSLARGVFSMFLIFFLLQGGINYILIFYLAIVLSILFLEKNNDTITLHREKDINNENFDVSI